MHKEPATCNWKARFQYIFALTEFLGRTIPKAKEVIEQKLTEHISGANNGASKNLPSIF